LDFCSIELFIPGRAFGCSPRIAVCFPYSLGMGHTTGVEKNRHGGIWVLGVVLYTRERGVKQD
jgi:hypothetical protein